MTIYVGRDELVWLGVHASWGKSRTRREKLGIGQGLARAGVRLGAGSY